MIWSRSIRRAGVVGVVGAAAAVAVAATNAGAMARPASVQPCAPRAASRGPTFVFGREGGNIRPASTALYADGRVSRGDSTDSSAAVSPDAVAGLARLARLGGFWTLRVPAVHRPPRNPDAARQYVEVHLTCGSHRVETAGGAPPPMRQLLALLQAVAPLRP